MNFFEKYLNTPCGKRLLEKYDLDEDGIWFVFGEDVNPDFAGSHITPYLKTIKGTLREALEEAVTLIGFWTWGCGGHLTNYIIKKPKEEPIGKAIEVMKIGQIPEDAKYMVLENARLAVPGDERSKTNPGHGYPGYDFEYMKVSFFTTEELLKDYIRIHDRKELSIFTVKPVKYKTDIVLL